MSGVSWRRRLLRWGVRVAAFLFCSLMVLRGLVWLGDRMPMITVTGEAVVEGPLTREPIQFVQKDFWFYPRKVQAELGHLAVPARRGVPNEPNVEVRYVRFPAYNPEAEAAPIVYLAGGPGGSGVDTASGDRFPFFMKLREAGDVIAFDQRGTRHTDPFPYCDSSYSYPLNQTADAGSMMSINEHVLRDCWAEWQGRLHPDAFTTEESAEDLESLRVALGVEKLNLVGISYGTHLALAYIRNYPERVERAVLAGVEGPDHTYKLPSVFDDVLRTIDETLETEAGWKGLVSDLQRGIERLDREAPRVLIEHPTTGEEAEVALTSLELRLAALYGFDERENYLRAAKRIRRIAEGDDELLAKFAVTMRVGGRPGIMALSMDCASGASPERLERLAEEEPTSLIREALNLDLITFCPFWPVQDLGETYRSDLVSKVPVLAVSGTLDTRTPPSNAEEVLAGFSNGDHLLIHGAGHGDDLLISSKEIAEAMARYFRTGDADTRRIDLPSL